MYFLGENKIDIRKYSSIYAALCTADTQQTKDDILTKENDTFFI